MASYSGSSALERSDVQAVLPKAIPIKEASHAVTRLLYNGDCYPARTVLAEALRRRFPTAAGARLSLSEAEVTNTLQRCGFSVLPRQDELHINIASPLFEILELQKHYSSGNTAEMSRRGILIRKLLPAIIRQQLSALEPIFTQAEFSCVVEGSDGKGRKNASAWVRIFDPFMSVSATQGWYIVIHFALSGDFIYVGLGCGATKYSNGSFVALPDSLITKRIEWARQTLAMEDKRFRSNVALNGNALSRQFEKAMAFAVAYTASDFNAGQFWDDLRVLSKALVALYRLERIGREPQIPSAKAEVLDQLTESAVNPAKPSTGQGRGLSAAERRAIELRAMEVAAVGLRNAGYSNIRDVSASSSFDFAALKNGQEWIVEVKGTSSTCADAFLLTATELALHRSSQGRSVLALVSHIELEKAGLVVTASAGVLELFEPWDISNWKFVPTAYRAEKL